MEIWDCQKLEGEHEVITSNLPSWLCGPHFPSPMLSPITPRVLCLGSSDSKQQFNLRVSLWVTSPHKGLLGIPSSPSLSRHLRG